MFYVVCKPKNHLPLIEISILWLRFFPAFTIIFCLHLSGGVLVLLNLMFIGCRHIKSI